MHRFHAEWIGGLLRIGDKGGPPFEDEKFISFGDLDAIQAARFAAWIIRVLRGASFDIPDEIPLRTDSLEYVPRRKTSDPDEVA